MSAGEWIEVGPGLHTLTGENTRLAVLERMGGWIWTAHVKMLPSLTPISGKQYWSPAAVGTCDSLEQGKQQARDALIKHLERALEEVRR